MLLALSRARRLTPTPPSPSSCLGASLVHVRTARYQAFEAAFDQDDLAEARRWHGSFTENSIPKGQTSYSRSSGPGGQHVNKTESKATTVWPVDELSRGLPKLMRSVLRTSRYYSKGNDSITIHAQTQRSRSANTDDNHTKLVEELQKMYRENVPAATSADKLKKHEALEKAAHQNRLKSKKQHSAKKSARKGRMFD